MCFGLSQLFRPSRYWVFMPLLLLVHGSVIGQQTSSEKEFDAEYARRIQLAEIDGVYIPVDLADAFGEIQRLSDAEDIAKFRDAAEDTISTRLHFGLGRWIIHNWGFYQGSRLSHHLKEELGLTHPDDMARLIIVSFHRHLNHRALDVEMQAKALLEKREKERIERERRKEVIYPGPGDQRN